MRGWRELLPGFWARLRPAAGFAVLGLLVMQVLPLRFNPGPWSLPVGVLLALAVVPLGYLIGRRSTLPATHPLGIAGVATTGVALGYIVYRVVPLLVNAWVIDGRTDAFPITYHWQGPPGAPPHHGHVAAAVVFVAMTTPLLAAVLSLIVRRRWRLGIPLASLGLPVMALVSWRVGVATSPGPAYSGVFFDPIASITGSRMDRGPFGLGQIDPDVSFVGTLLLLGAIVTAYGFGLATRDRAATAPAPPPDDSAPEWTLARAATAAGWVAAVVGIGGWIYATSILPLSAGRDAALAVLVAESGDELRWGAVILTVLGVRVAATRRRGATLAALLIGGWLLTAEAVLTRPALIAGPLPAGTAAAIAVIGVGLAWWVSGRPMGQAGDSDAIATRRTLAVAAVVAAACGPLLIVQIDIRQDTAASVGLLVARSVVPATFVALAVFVAAAARRRPVRPIVAAALALAPVTASAAAGIATTATAATQGIVLLVAAGAAGLFAAGAGALALAERGRAARWSGWALGMVLAPFAVAPAAFYASVVPDILLRTAGDSGAYPVAATSFQPGVLLVVLPAAAVLARWLIPDHPTTIRDGVPTVQTGLASGSHPTAAPAGA